jgi:hypothetical protein
MKKWKVLLTAFLEEIDSAEERAKEDCYFVATREIELPFIPRKGMEITGLVPDDEGKDGFLFDGAEIVFQAERVIWDFTKNAWRVLGEINVLLPHESTPESLAENHPGWSFRYYDGRSFDEDGNPVEEKPDE